MEEPGRLKSMGHKKLDMTEQLTLNGSTNEVKTVIPNVWGTRAKVEKQGQIIEGFIWHA